MASAPSQVIPQGIQPTNNPDPLGSNDFVQKDQPLEEFLSVEGVIASIEEAFLQLETLCPDEPWGYRHPAIAAWMHHYGFKAVHELTDKALVAILLSLRKRLEHLQQQPKERRISHA